jgi:hypothetical protein
MTTKTGVELIAEDADAKDIARELLEKILDEDVGRLGPFQTQLTKKSSRGKPYKMIRKDLAIEAMIKFSNLKKKII